ncbi:17183_t:CDS:2, partial [Funneliformis geosporum]
QRTTCLLKANIYPRARACSRRDQLILVYFGTGDEFETDDGESETDDSNDFKTDDDVLITSVVYIWPVVKKGIGSFQAQMARHRNIVLRELTRCLPNISEQYALELEVCEAKLLLVYRRVVGSVKGRRRLLIRRVLKPDYLMRS